MQLDSQRIINGYIAGDIRFFCTYRAHGARMMPMGVQNWVATALRHPKLFANYWQDPYGFAARLGSVGSDVCLAVCPNPTSQAGIA